MIIFFVYEVNIISHVSNEYLRGCYHSMLFDLGKGLNVNLQYLLPV